MKKLYLRKDTRKAVAFFLCLAMTLTFIPTFGTATAEAASPTASGSWADYAVTDWYDAGDTEYNINTAEQLAGLALLVNNGTTDFANVKFTLTDSIDLDEHYWVPIGGASTPIQGVPSGPAFSGAFDGSYNGADGSGASITNMTIDPETLDDGNAGFGLFGYVDGGSIANVSVSGSIDATSTKAVSTAVGGVAGYIYGNISNAHSAVDINLSATSNVSSGIGGIAGVIENTTDSVPDFGTTSTAGVFIQNSSNSGDIAGGTRAAGIAGAVYAVTNGGVVVRTSYNSGNISTEVGGSRVYCGGVVGYSRGHQSQLGNIGNVSSDGGHYISGLVALLQGAAPEANLTNSFSVGQITNMPGYSQQLYSDVDDSKDMELTDLFWSLNNEPPSQENTPGTAWGNPVDVLGLRPDQIANIDPIDLSTGSDTIVNALNYPQSGIFTTGTVTVAALDNTVLTPPEMIFPESVTPAPIPPINGPTDTDDTVHGVFLDGTADAGGDGTQDSPFNNFDDAKNALDNSSGSKTIIYITNTVSISGTERWMLGNPGTQTVKRSSVFDGYLVDVESDDSLYLTEINIDGNWKSDSGTLNAGRSLIEVNNNGNLEIGQDTVLTNNYAGSGGLVRIEGGNVTMDAGASLTSSAAISNAGAVAVYTSDVSGSPQGRFTMNGGEISGNTAGNGGALYVQNNAVATINGGTIQDNTASNNGGGIYLDANGDVTFTGGTVTGNTADNLGNGIYIVTSGGIQGNLTLDQYNTITVATNNAIYLPTGVLIELAYDVEGASIITVESENPVVNTNIATASDQSIVQNSVTQFNYYNAAHSFDYTNASPYYIFIAS